MLTGPGLRGDLVEWWGWVLVAWLPVAVLVGIALGRRLRAVERTEQAAARPEKQHRGHRTSDRRAS